MIKPGVTTMEIDKFVEEYLLEEAYQSKGYHSIPMPSVFNKR